MKLRVGKVKKPAKEVKKKGKTGTASPPKPAPVQVKIKKPDKIPGQKEITPGKPSPVRRLGKKKEKGDSKSSESGKPESIEKKSLFHKLGSISPLSRKREKYDPKVHGMMVDLTFQPPPGTEEIEVYPVNPPYAYIRITYNYSTHEYLYEVVEPLFSDAEVRLLDELKKGIFERVNVNTRQISRDTAAETLESMMNEVLT
ncbi:MAG: secretion system protein E, partial [Methanospirillum sp.]|nr:secretion system protein E [Methanospirillum sp.]